MTDIIQLFSVTWLLASYSRCGENYCSTLFATQCKSIGQMVEYFNTFVLCCFVFYAHSIGKRTFSCRTKIVWKKRKLHSAFWSKKTSGIHSSMAFDIMNFLTAAV